MRLLPLGRLLTLRAEPGKSPGVAPPCRPGGDRPPPARLEEFAERWDVRYPAVIRPWRAAWAEFLPFLDYDVEIRRVICITDAIEGLDVRYRRALRTRGHFPNEQGTLECLAEQQPHAELGADCSARRSDPDVHARRLARQFEKLGFQVTIEPEAA
jgi:Transposase, Mutator family